MATLSADLAQVEVDLAQVEVDLAKVEVDLAKVEIDLAKVEAYMQASGWQRGPDGIWAKDGRRYSVEVVYSQEDGRVGRITLVTCKCGTDFDPKDVTKEQQQTIRRRLLRDVASFGKKPVACVACREKSQADPRSQLNIYLQKHHPEHVPDVNYLDWQEANRVWCCKVVVNLGHKS